MQSLTKAYYNRRYSIEHGNENHPMSMSIMMIIMSGFHGSIHCYSGSRSSASD
jgi:hypothetical protein